MTTLLGYHDHPPYLWWIDLAARSWTPAAGVTGIPQGIDEFVPLDERVAVRCGPGWYTLPVDLSGELEACSKADEARAQARSQHVRVVGSHDSPTVGLALEDQTVRQISHPDVCYWHVFSATRSPDGQFVAIAGSTAPRPPLSDLEAAVRGGGDYRKQSTSALAIVDLRSGTIDVRPGRFDNFCYPPVWFECDSRIILGASFEANRLYVTALGGGALECIEVEGDVPMPLIDAAAL